MILENDNLVWKASLTKEFRELINFKIVKIKIEIFFFLQQECLRTRTGCKESKSTNIKSGSNAYQIQDRTRGARGIDAWSSAKSPILEVINHKE